MLRWFKSLLIRAEFYNSSNGVHAHKVLASSVLRSDLKLPHLIKSVFIGFTSPPCLLTCTRRLAGVPDEDAPVVGWAGEHVVVDRTDGQTVHGVDVQEHVQSLLSVGRAVGRYSSRLCLRSQSASRWDACASTRVASRLFYSPFHVVKNHLLVVSCKTTSRESVIK